MSGGSSRAADKLRRGTGDHYKTLGIKRTATHAEVKTAYYQKSLKYHPDHNPDCEAAAESYRQVAAAYEVLGQEHLRTRYDRGFAGPRERAVDPRTREYQRSQSPFESEQSRYDFQMWYSEHYGEARRQEQERRARREREWRDARDFQMEDSQQSRWAEFGGSLVVMVAIFLALKRG